MTNPTLHAHTSHSMTPHSESLSVPVGSEISEETPQRQPLRHHVQSAVEQYFAELEGEMPTQLYDTILQEVEKPLLAVVLEQTQGNQSKAAKILGLNRGTLRKKMQLYGFM